MQKFPKELQTGTKKWQKLQKVGKSRKKLPKFQKVGKMIQKLQKMQKICYK